MSENLFEAYCRDELDLAQREKLQAMLANDEVARARFVEHVLFRSALISCHRQQAGLPQAAAERQVGEETATRPRRLGRRQRRPVPRANRRRLVGFFAACAAVAAVLMVFIWPAAGPIASAAGEGAQLVRAGTSIPLVKSMRVQRGDRLVAGDSPLDLRFGDGSTLALKNGSLQVESWNNGKRLELESGQVQGDITPQGSTPLRITGPRTEATVLGTRFEMRTGTDWSSLAVTSGQVRYTRSSDGDALEVTAGEIAYLAPGVPWQRYPQGGAVCHLLAKDARLDPTSDWRLVKDAEAADGFALEDANHRAEREFFSNKGGVPPTARFTLFAEAGITYTLWIHGRTLPSTEPAYHTDSVFVIIDGAEWLVTSWNRDVGWEWYPKNHPFPPAFFNSWATRYPNAAWGWVAGPGDPDDIGVPDRLPLRFPRTGTYELQLVPTSGPMRVDRMVLKPGEDAPP